jgi:hypothetical protein
MKRYHLPDAAPRIRFTLISGGIAATIAAVAVASGGVGYASSFAPEHDASGGGGSCSVPSRYRTIQAAVAVATCATIRVAPGTYAESVAITRSLTLSGAKSGQDARSRHGGGESIINGGALATITITADNVTIDGFTLTGPSNPGTAALVMQSRNSGETVQNNIINNAGRAASITTSKTVFRRNAVKNTATASDGFEANSTPVQNVTISGNSFSGATPAGYHADITFIEGNANVTVADNKSTGDGTLVALFKTAGARVTGNTVVGGGGASAIYVGGGDKNVLVSGNTVSAAGAAVKVANAFKAGTNANVNITGNILRKNEYGVNVAVGSTSTIVQANRNSIAGSTAYGVFNDPASGAATNATCNWWGTKSGPGPVGPGTGDKISTGVTYQPWLKSSQLSGACHPRNH